MKLARLLPVVLVALVALVSSPLHADEAIVETVRDRLDTMRQQRRRADQERGVAMLVPRPRPALAPDPPVPLEERRPEAWVRSEDVARGLEQIDRLLRAYEAGDRIGVEDAFSRTTLAERGIFGNAAADDFMRETAIRVEWHLYGLYPAGEVPAVRIRWNRSATDQRTGVPRVESGISLITFDPEDDFRIRNWTGSAPFGRTDPQLGDQLRAGQPVDRTGIRPRP